MTGPILELTADDLVEAAGAIDLLAVVDADLRRRAGSGADTAGRSAGQTAGDITVREPGSRRAARLPKSALSMIWTCALAGTAAQWLHAGGVATAAVIGSGPAALVQLGVIARHLPDVCHIAVYTGSAADQGEGADGLQPLGRGVLDHLELTGSSPALFAEVRQAVFGTSLLLIVLGAGPDRLDFGRLPRGVLIVNAAGRDLPENVVRRVDQLFVDDLGLLEANRHRAFVRTHLSGPPARSVTTLPRPGGLHRHPAGWRHRRRVDGDLGQVLTGAHRGRTHMDDIVLVELLGTSAPDGLTGLLLRAAAEQGLGKEVAREGGEDDAVADFDK